MKNAFKLFLTDLKRVAKTPAAWVILGGLAILPSFYAWFNLWAMWDPYSNTGHIKVAVVNEDQGDKIRGKKINVGNTLEDTLKNNDKFDWQFVSREKAIMKYEWVNIMQEFIYLRNLHQITEHFVNIRKKQILHIK